MTKWEELPMGRCSLLVGLRFQLPIFGPDNAAVKGVLENIMAVSGGDEFNVICIEEAVC